MPGSFSGMSAGPDPSPSGVEAAARDGERQRAKPLAFAPPLAAQLDDACERIDLGRHVDRAALLVRQELARAGQEEGRGRPDPEPLTGEGPRRGVPLLGRRAPFPGAPHRKGEPEEQRAAHPRRPQNTTRKEKNVGFDAESSEPVRKVRARSTPTDPLVTPMPTLGPLKPSRTNAYPPRTRSTRW